MPFKKGNHLGKEFKKGLMPWNKNKHFNPHNEETRFKKGNVPWDKGITRPKFSEEWLQNLSKASKGRPKSEAHKEKMRALWRNPEYARKTASAQKRKPSRDEIYVDAILQLNFPNRWKYIGDGHTWIAGLNPDFINKLDHVLIESNGYVFKDGSRGHTPVKDKARTEHFARHGNWHTINLYKPDLNWREQQRLVDKIRQEIEVFLRS